MTLTLPGLTGLMYFFGMAALVCLTGVVIALETLRVKKRRNPPIGMEYAGWAAGIFSVTCVGCASALVWLILFVLG